MRPLLGACLHAAVTRGWQADFPEGTRTSTRQTMSSGKSGAPPTVTRYAPTHSTRRRHPESGVKLRDLSRRQSNDSHRGGASTQRSGTSLLRTVFVAIQHDCFCIGFIGTASLTRGRLWSSGWIVSKSTPRPAALPCTRRIRGGSSGRQPGPLRNATSTSGELSCYSHPLVG
jgi:hypothetical protein